MTLQQIANTVRTILVLFVAVAFANVAEAGFVQIDVGNSTPNPGHGPPDFVWEKLPDAAGNAKATLAEIFGPEIGESFEVQIAGATDSDPVLTLTKNIANSSGFDWSGYNIDLSGGTATFINGTASSDVFSLTSETSSSLVFSGPPNVLDGGSVSFTFDILIPTIGDFDFTLTQSPQLVPEPSTAVLIVAAGFGLLFVHRRFA